MALKESVKVDIYKLDIYKKLNKIYEGTDVSLVQLESLLDNAVYRIYYSDDGSIANKDNMLDKFSGGEGLTNYITYDEFDEMGFATKATIKNSIIPSAAFAGQASLTDCQMIGEITSIGNNAFNECASLAWTSLPSGVTTIGDQAFMYCDSLALTSLPDGLTSIGSNAFYSCRNLALTSLPAGLTSIEEYAFLGCTNLALTELPSKLTSIGSTAFSGCTSLTSLTFKGTPDSLSGSAFNDCTNLVDIKVPWSNGTVYGVPWGAYNATITYDYNPTV